MKKENYYSNSMNYYCSKCDKPHDTLSKIGKQHIKFASKEIQKIIFIKYGIY